MNIRKSKQSWFFFAIYVITYLYFALCLGYTLSRMLDFGTDIWSCTVVVMVILFALVGCVAALIILLRFGSNGTSDKKKARARRARLFQTGRGFFSKEIFPAVCSYLLAVVSRGIYLGMIPQGRLTGKTWIYETVTQSAGAAGSGGFGFLGADALYASLLKGFCILLGNEPAAVSILNLICQALVVVGCYLFVRIAAGRAAAIAGTVLFLCVPYFYKALYACEPAQLHAALCAVLAGMLAAAVKRDVCGGERKGMVVWYLLLGVLSGMLLLSDLSAVLIPAGVLVVYFTSVDNRRAEPVCYLTGMAAGAAAVSLLSAGGVEKYPDYVSGYFARFGGSVTIEGVLTIPEDLVLFGILAFGGIAAVMFFKCGHDVLRVIGVPYFGLALLKALSGGQTDTVFLIYCIAVIAAAMAVGMIFIADEPVAVIASRPASKDNTADSEEEEKKQKETASEGKTKKLKKTVPKEEKNTARKAEKKRKKAATKEEEKKRKKAATEEEKKQKKTVAEEGKKQEGTAPEEEQRSQERTAPEEEQRSQERTASEEEQRSQERTTSEEEKNTASEGKVNLIENPLPLPKKHVHREMDYGYDVPEAQMHYDVSVAESDDFDR